MLGEEELSEYYEQEKRPAMMDSSIVEKILKEEGMVSQFYNKCYQLLPSDKLDLLLSLRPETQQVVVRYIRGDISCDGLLEREQGLIKRLRNEYSGFLQKQKNNLNEKNDPFQIKLDQINEIIYNNFFHRVSFNILENKENERDREEAIKLAKRLGFQSKLDINN
jgi:hypothetical protein